MAKPFDATPKDLITRHPYDWAHLAGFPNSIELKVIDSELSTVTAEADRVILVVKPHRCLLDFELMASHDLTIIERFLKYGGLLVEKYRLPVHQTLVLLRREADSPQFTGKHYWCSPYGSSGLTLEYEVLRVWELPVRKLLEGGVGLLPVAPLADDAVDALPEVIREMGRRLESEVPPVEAADLWTATYTLMGLRYDPIFAAKVLRGARQMRESLTYQAILEEGRQEGRQEGMQIAGSAEARKILQMQGRLRFGEPSPKVLNLLESESGVERLEELAQRLLVVNSWEELFS